MAFINEFTTARITIPDYVVLLAAIKSSLGDSTATISGIWQNWHAEKATAWTPTQIIAVQNLLDTTIPVTLELLAQRDIDFWPIELKALALAIIDQLNVIRAALPIPLAAITPAQAIAAIRAKSGTL